MVGFDKYIMKKLIQCLFLLLFGTMSFAQVKPKKNITLGDEGGVISNTNNNPNQQGEIQNEKSSTPRKDSLAFEHRDDAKDALLMTAQFLDSTRKSFLDSTVNDFDKYFSVPSSFVYLGNNGAAAKSLVFSPTQQIGFDQGFHAFDVYKFNLETTKFYQTNRPFSSISYQLASGKEQMLQAFHTQNPKPNLNIGFEYKMITAPGFFVTQNTNHSSYRIFGSYQGLKKRYQQNIVIIGNNIRASQNGGIENTSDLLDPNRKDRFTIPVNLGNNAAFKTNPFVTSILTGNQNKDFSFFIRQHYDFGKRDSIAVNDSTMTYLFFPKLRIQHSFVYQKQQVQFGDIFADSTFYQNWFNIGLKSKYDTFSIGEIWREIKNDFSIVQFPDTKNTAQFLLAGITLQNLLGDLKSGKNNFYNLFVHGEYRNRTKNKKWDIIAYGNFYINGLNAGDYKVSGSINRYLNKRFGNIQLWFNNSNRTPSNVFNEQAVFNLGDNSKFKKENITSFGLKSDNLFATFGFSNHLLINYAYFVNNFQASQYSTLINVLQFSMYKKIRLTRRINWHADLCVQQTNLASPIRVPAFYSRNRIAYEGVFFKNLNVSTGLELRYFTPFKANGFSPITQQFVNQDSITIRNLPDVSAFLHFRIKGFTGFLRAENLNTMNFKNGFGFTNNNFAAPFYPTQGFMLRFGVKWWMVN